MRFAPKQKAFLTSLLLLLSGPSFATLVNYSGNQPITESGQTFTWVGIPVVTSIGSGTLTFEAAGDFNTAEISNPSSENSQIDLDGIFSAGPYSLSNSDFVEFNTPEGQFWKNIIEIDASIMTLLTQDKVLTVTVTNSVLVNPIWDNGFVSWSLSYDGKVPEPTSLALFLLGLVGFGALDRVNRTIE